MAMGKVKYLIVIIQVMLYRHPLLIPIHISVNHIQEE